MNLLKRLRCWAPAALLASGAIACGSALAQGPDSTHDSTPRALPAQPRETAARISEPECRRIVDALAAFGTRHTLSDTASPTRGIGAARNWIRDELTRSSRAGGGRMRVEFESFDLPPGPRVPNGATVINVVAVLPGTMPEASRRAYYVVGHYDSRASEGLDADADSPGANDNASGTAVVMEIARVLADQPLESTVVFLATAGEEQGLLGAKAHADKMASTKAYSIMGVLNNDIVGDPYGETWGGTRDPADRAVVRVFSEGLPRNASAEQLSQIRSLGSEVDSSNRQLARYVAEIADLERTAVRARVTYRLDRFLRGGDHTPFSEAGFPAVRFTAPREDYARQHQDVRTVVGNDGEPIRYGDTPEFVDAGYIADVARLNATVLVHLASAPSPPTSVRMLTAELTTNTTLRWTASPEPDTAGYEVVWRATTSPTWDHARDIGNTQEATIDLSKDDWFFGVRAYDRDGYRSPVVFAGAARE
jgi:Zn-dependent M28 family amino/carboxypeptidase